MNFLHKSIGRSIIFYRRDTVTQVLIIMLLSAIITGSLFTGHSVRESLRKSSSGKLGNTGILISSGLRYFNSSVAERIYKETDEKAVSIMEMDGYCQNFVTGATALKIKIYSVTDSFWQFHGIDSLNIKPGTVAINSILARHLGVAIGDEVIIRFSDPDPVPDNAPFAPSKDDYNSRVLLIGSILDVQHGGDFSLGISQIAPMNIFLNESDLRIEGSLSNRLLIENINHHPVKYFYEIFSKLITPADIGLTVRQSEKTGEPELISDRIFIDSAFVSDVLALIPSGKPLITYLGNSFVKRNYSTPYSFITAIGADIDENLIWITKWLADDILAKTGDTLALTWYEPSYGNKTLTEKNESFIIGKILDIDHPMADPSLMPDFPGISGSTTCSGWDAGVPILMDQIRAKDEEYWNRYRGTPKAFISYNSGRRLWGNNFGSATAIRFPETLQKETIIETLTGSIDPQKMGFVFTDTMGKSNDAASQSVDFSTLFLSLAFFIIVSCIILLSLAVSIFFEKRKSQIRTFFAIGFINRKISNLLFSETMLISVAGSLPGIFLGYILSRLTITALNSVWTGAVQTNTLSVHFSIIPLLIGFIATEIIVTVLLIFKTKRFLKSLNKKESGELKEYLPKNNRILLFLSLLLTILIITLSLLSSDSSVELSFTGGTLLFVTLVLLIRYYFLRKRKINQGVTGNILRKYYFFHPAHVVTPVIFIAAGIFAVMITGANKKVIGDKMFLRSGGTGGYSLWAESAVPVRKNLNGDGRKEYGLDEDDLKEMIIVQAVRLPGDDASCLNLNHIIAPPILGIDPANFIERGSFSFATSIKKAGNENPWELLNSSPGENVIYGVADQTVLQWGLKIKTGDTLVFNSENGRPLKIVICAGLKSSVFQGYLLIGSTHFEKYYPSVSGNSIFLIDGDKSLSDYYSEILSQRLSGYGLSVERSGEKLASFHQVTNTYLDVFVVLGIFGMVMGAGGLGFILILNFNQRRGEFALMMATGYNIRRIRNLLLRDQLFLLFWGILTGTCSGLLATLPSLRSGSEVPWGYIPIMIIAVFTAGLTAMVLSLNNITGSSLIALLRKD